MLLQDGQNLLYQPGKHSITWPCMAEQDLLQKQNKYMHIPILASSKSQWKTSTTEN